MHQKQNKQTKQVGQKGIFFPCPQNGRSIWTLFGSILFSIFVPQILVIYHLII